MAPRQRLAQPPEAAHRLSLKLHNFRLPLHGVRVNGRVVGTVGHQLPESGLLLQLAFHLLPENNKSCGSGLLRGNISLTQHQTKAATPENKVGLLCPGTQLPDRLGKAFWNYHWVSLVAFIEPEILPKWVSILFFEHRNPPRIYLAG